MTDIATSGLKQMHGAWFVSGIDTDAGKSYCTGWLADQLTRQGIRTITQKFVQTGNTDMSEDILLHRSIMGTGLFPADLDHTTAPLIYTHLLSSARSPTRPARHSARHH